MIEPRTGRVTGMGDFLPSVGAQAPCTRHCTRCGARLRHHNHDTYCAPCNDIVHPWVMPEPHSKRYYDDCACGAKKSVTSKTCVTCYRERRRARRRKPVDGRLKARADGLCADCGNAPHRPRHSLCVKCSNARYRSVA